MERSLNKPGRPKRRPSITARYGGLMRAGPVATPGKRRAKTLLRRSEMKVSVIKDNRDGIIYIEPGDCPFLRMYETLLKTTDYETALKEYPESVDLTKMKSLF
jgi:hypothetical protein